MTLVEFEEEILDLIIDLAPNAQVVVSEEGEVLIFTNLHESEDGELVEIEFNDEDNEFMGGDEDAEQLQEEDKEDEND